MQAELSRRFWRNAARLRGHAKALATKLNMGRESCKAPAPLRRQMKRRQLQIPRWGSSDQAMQAGGICGGTACLNRSQLFDYNNLGPADVVIVLCCP